GRAKEIPQPTPRAGTRAGMGLNELTGDSPVEFGLVGAEEDQVAPVRTPDAVQRGADDVRLGPAVPNHGVVRVASLCQQSDHRPGSRRAAAQGVALAPELDADALARERAQSPQHGEVMPLGIDLQKAHLPRNLAALDQRAKAHDGHRDVPTLAVPGVVANP